jgi:hypothetical protein
MIMKRASAFRVLVPAHVEALKESELTKGPNSGCMKQLQALLPCQDIPAPVSLESCEIYLSSWQGLEVGLPFFMRAINLMANKGCFQSSCDE